MVLKKIFIVLVSVNVILTANFCYANGLAANDPFYYRQWYLDHLNMPLVWQEQTGASSVIIAVIDSGVDVTHPDLHDNIWVNQDEIIGDNLDNDFNGYIDDANGWDFIANNNDPGPKYQDNCVNNETCIEEAVWHGTFVSGVAAAVGNNGLGITGIAWKVKIMPLRVLDEYGGGNTGNVIKAIDYAIANRADIINLSFVGDSYDIYLEQALQRAYAAGIVIVAAAGNEDFNGHVVDLDEQKRYPVCHQGKNGENIVMGVGAIDSANKLAVFSNYGSSCLDIMAPGEDFFGTLLYDSDVPQFADYYGSGFSGTSLSAPLISGLVALIKSAKPSLSNREIQDLITKTADNIDSVNPLYIGSLGAGLVNPARIFSSLIARQVGANVVKGSGNTIYYQAVNNKRYVFLDEKTYLSWYDNFKDIKLLTDAELANLPLGGVVTARPGSLVKIQTDPKVYAVAQGGVLRWVNTEQLALQLYGQNWQLSVKDVPDSFFINYTIGLPINNATEFNPYLEKNEVISIDMDKGLM